MAKALLVLFGGRSMPNMLTIIHEEPDLIVPIISKDYEKLVPLMESSIEELFKHSEKKPVLDTSYVVDAFDLNDIQEKCSHAIQKYSDFDWIFNITSATTIMSIGAFEVAKTFTAQGTPIRCWYLDTAHTNVVALIGEPRNVDIFHIGVEQLATVYNCKIGKGKLEGEHEYCQNHWLPFAEILVNNPHYIDLLKKFLKKTIKKTGPSKGIKDIEYTLISVTDGTYTLLEEARKVDLLNHLERNGNTICVRLNYLQGNFLDGPWLEVYVWNEARKLDIFSDCQWNQKIVDLKKLDDKDSKNELDVTMIYKANLLIAECKTGDDSFSTDTIYKIDSVAGSLGGNFVAKILVTSFSTPGDKDRNQQRSYQELQQKADERGIVIVTREGLKDIGKVIEQQAKKPKRPRH